MDNAYKEFKQNRQNYEELEKSNNYAQVVINHYPKDLKDVALLLFALPPTQVSVEQLFSMVKIVKSDLRSSLNEESLDSILFLRANKSIKIKI